MLNPTRNENNLVYVNIDEIYITSTKMNNQ
jgi:hypothetical protein